VVLVGALVVARTCGSQGEVSREEAIEIAKGEAAFTPCAERGCVVVHAVQQGIPTRLVWIVGLAESLDEDGRPTRFANFRVDARTGEIARS
jgi:hypothetical protein